ncbi:ABC transporter substrate-binding protein [Pseudonocardia sp. NPDC049154]|uniref:ABC transporter substrate-binding protein n=1 Tax=Pseudonocardia sp. NPDC049154 TaxID=3155501 RepID=UPI0033F3A655
MDTEATLRILYAGPTQSLDPIKQNLTSSQPATFLLYDRLTRLANDFTVKPMLATSWEFTPDGSTLTLKLRTDVKFHDGTPVDAAAVKANIERGKSTPGSTVATQLSDVAAVEVLDPATVRLVLKPGAGAALPAVFASNAGEIVSPKAIADGRDLGQAPGDAGSGPYVVSTFKPSDTVSFERAPSTYWDTEAGSPKKVDITFTQAAATRLNAVRAGNADVAQINGPDVATADQLAQSGAFKVSKVSVLTQQALYLRGTDPLFADVRVRQAISHGIDRDAIANQLLQGNCTPLVQPYPPGHWAHVDGLENTAFDPDRAKQLVAEIGTPITFPLTYPAGSSFEPVAQVLQSQLAAVGITATLTPLPPSDADAAYREGRTTAYVGSLAAVADPSQLIRTTYLGGYNAGDAVRDQITPLTQQAENPTLTQQQRGALYGQVWTTLADQAALVNICATKQDWAYRNPITNVDDMTWTWAGLFDARYVAVTNAG